MSLTALPVPDSSFKAAIITCVEQPFLLPIPIDCAISVSSLKVAQYRIG